MSQRVLSILTVLYLVLQRFFLFFFCWVKYAFYSSFHLLMAQIFFPFLLFPFNVRLTIFIPAFYTSSNIKLMCYFRFPAILFPFVSSLRDLLLSILFLFSATLSCFIILTPLFPYTVSVLLLLVPRFKHNLFLSIFHPLCTLFICSAVHFMLYLCFSEYTLQ